MTEFPEEWMVNNDNHAVQLLSGVQIFLDRWSQEGLTAWR
jgi:hypothetical protein